MSKVEQAKQCFEKGLNCCQSVLLPFCEQYGISRDDAARIACGMGGGMRAGEICGAVSGAVAVLGLKYCPDEAGYPQARLVCGGKVAEFHEAFMQQHGSLRCADLLGCNPTSPEGGKRQAAGEFKAQCTGYVASAAGILEAMED